MTAPTRKSANAARICAATCAAGTRWIAETCRVVCAVTAVMAARPCTPKAAKVFRSVAMPAPPLESDPEMARALAVMADFGIECMIFATRKREMPK